MDLCCTPAHRRSLPRRLLLRWVARRALFDRRTIRCLGRFCTPLAAPSQQVALESPQ